MENHSHHHDHSHQIDFKKLNQAFYIGIGLNLLYVFLEAAFGLFYNSLALLSDAGHNLSDVVSLVLSLVAFKLLQKKANKKYTYGYRKATILASLLNALLLIFAVGFIIFEAIGRFSHPQKIEGSNIAIVAFVGIVINGITAWLFMKDQTKDLNVKGAYLHMLADALVSVGVVIGGVLISLTHWFWLDPFLSIIIGLVILFGTWNLLTQSLKLSMDGVPENIDVENITVKIKKLQGVKDVQHVHIWALSTTENALTAHIQIDEKLSVKEIETLKSTIKHELEHENIQHSTLETYCGDKKFEEEI